MFYLVYSIVFFLVGFLVVNKKQVNKNIYKWYYFTIVLFWGMAYHYAIDTPVYMQYYEYDVVSLRHGLRLFVSRYEFGFNLLAHICKTISTQYAVFQTIILGVEMALIIKGMKELLDERSMIFALPLLFFIFPHLLNAPRQGLAVAIFIYALRFINEEKPWKYLVCIIIATLFHQSALVLTVFFLVKYLNKVMTKDWIVFGVLIISDVLFVSGVSISNNISFITDFLLGGYIDMGAKYATNYIYEEDVLADVGFLKMLEVNATVILYTLFCKGEKKFELFRFFLMVTVILEFLFGGLFAHRLLYYFEIIYYICFVMGIKQMMSRYNISVQASYIVISFYMVYFYIFHCSYINKVYYLFPSANLII